MNLRWTLQRLALTLCAAALLTLSGCPDDGGDGATQEDTQVADAGGDAAQDAADTAAPDVAADTAAPDTATPDDTADTATPDDTAETPDVPPDTGDTAETPDVTPDTDDTTETPDVTPDADDTTETPDVTPDTDDTTPTCDPACTEGQTCVDGTCVDDVPVCDPACGNDHVCVNGTCLPKTAHAELAELDGPFASGPEVTAKCIACHADVAESFLQTSHWTWKGPTPGMAGHEAETHGKVDMVNNFCIAIASNEGRCTQCHAGYGWKDATFDFANAGNIDCLVCHDTSGVYKKDPKTAGNVMDGVDLTIAAKSVGAPSNAACGACHFGAGGGDNVKKGDMGSWAKAPAPEADVHMGNGITCAECHSADAHTMKGGGLPNPVLENELACTDCHQGPELHGDAVLDTHTLHVACQTCHIPAFSRQQPTKMEWYWSTAGDADRVPVMDQWGKPDYDKMKGDFVWGKDVEPVLAWSNGSFTRMLVGDTYDAEPVDLGSPVGSIGDPDSRIAPFKVMKGNQPADTVNKRMAVPHLFGKPGGDNPYWSMWDWALAVAEGMSYAGVDYSGTFGFVETSLFLELNHEIAPKELALGCSDCHNGGIDFAALGYLGDPMVTGGQHATVCLPECGAGQTCKNGACVDVAVCDPACGAGQACVNGVCIAQSVHANLPQLAGPFADGPAVTAQCITCHADVAEDFVTTSHWTWMGPTPGMVGHEAEAHGKADVVNNFCIAIASNEGRCTQCHAGYGWKDGTFDFADKGKIDCLVCHDTSGKYAKDPKTAGNVAAGVDLVVAARSVGAPTNAACGACHFSAGGGDNVKKGDMGSWAKNPTPDADVHMGNGVTCADCHAGPGHTLTGSGLPNPVHQGDLACTDCHQGPDVHTNATLNDHTAHIACETCHIPAFSRQQPTKLEWYWETAGDGARVPVLDQWGKPDYDKMKGDFVWGKNVEPVLAWSNGAFTRMVVGDTYDTVPVDLGSPVGGIDDPDARITPFKVMKGSQPADTVNKRIAVPHLFGTAGGPNPYWSMWDWALAVSEGMAYAGVEYSGTFEFVETTLHLELHHEIAPKAQARQCMDCHNGGIDFIALGYTGDPMVTGGQHATE